MGLSTKTLTESFGRIAAKIQTHADELNALDAKIGDGDLGVTLTRCARGVAEILPRLPEDVGMALMGCVQAVTKMSGASFATLLATAFMSVAKASKGRTEIPWIELSDLLRVAEEAMMARGKASLGEKTVIDALDAVRVATEGLNDPKAILEAAIKAVNEVVKRMKGQPNMAGRARIWSEKSIGLDDPGMVAFKLMIESLED
jgi:phosphoenolpyruvate---glycerone phosphotransferase subunit DhaL